MPWIFRKWLGVCRHVAGVDEARGVILRAPAGKLYCISSCYSPWLVLLTMATLKFRNASAEVDSHQFTRAAARLL